MKHVGKMKNNSARVIVPYRTVPGEQHNCLVVGTQGLIDSHHDSLMALIESTEGQQANELADILSVRKFPDGSNMLQYLHANGHLKKVSTTMVLMTPNNQTSIPLNELNELIAKQKGIAVSDLSVSDNPSEKKEKVAETTVNPTVETALETKDKFQLAPSEMRSRADALYKEAARLRKEADELDPPKKKSKKDTITV
jgi:hypothetical protein